MDKNLGFGSDEYSEEIGQVDLFGLDEFGQNPGADAIWGAAVGVGLSTGTSIALRAMVDKDANPDIYKWSEGIGFLVGGGVSGAMAAMEKTRYAGWVGLMSAFLSNGLRQIETLLFTPKTEAEKAAEKAAADKKAADEAAAKEAARIAALTTTGDWGRLPQFAAPVVEMAGPVVERLGLSGSRPPISFAGNSHLGAGARDVQIQGGPAIDGLGAHFGATLFG